MTSKKNMTANRKPRRIHRNKGGRKKGKKVEAEKFDWFKGLGSNSRTSGHFFR